MMKRLFWMVVGYSLGLATGWYVQRRVKHTVERFAPEQVRNDVTDRSRQAVDRALTVVDDLRDAASEGLNAMREERSMLLAEFAEDEALHIGPARRISVRRRTIRTRRPGTDFRPEGRSGTGRKPSR
jgi:hypothetical protein